MRDRFGIYEAARADSGAMYDPDMMETKRLMSVFTNECMSRKGLCSVRLAWVSPKKYLSLTPPVCGFDPERPGRTAAECSEGDFFDYYDKEMRTKLTEMLKRGQELDPVWVDLTCKQMDEHQTCTTYSHEGRHRARIAQDLGIPFIPAIIIEENYDAQNHYDKTHPEPSKGKKR